MGRDVVLRALGKADRLGALEPRLCLLGVPDFDRILALGKQLAVLPRRVSRFGKAYGLERPKTHLARFLGSAYSVKSNSCSRSG